MFYRNELKGVLNLANHKSALKRARQNEIKRTRNKSIRTRVKNAAKLLRTAPAEENRKNLEIELKTTQSIIDKAAKQGVIHKKTASRKISRLTKTVNKIQA